MEATTTTITLDQLPDQPDEITAVTYIDNPEWSECREHAEKSIEQTATYRHLYDPKTIRIEVFAGGDNDDHVCMYCADAS